MSDTPQIPIDPDGKRKDGWDWFDQTQDKVDEVRELEAGLDRDDLMRHYASVFRGKSGKIVMDDLMRWMKIGATFDPSMGFHNGAAFGFYREGQNSMVRYIEEMAIRGKQ